MEHFAMLTPHEQLLYRKD